MDSNQTNPGQESDAGLKNRSSDSEEQRDEFEFMEMEVYDLLEATREIKTTSFEFKLEPVSKKSKVEDEDEISKLRRTLAILEDQDFGLNFKHETLNKEDQLNDFIRGVTAFENFMEKHCNFEKDIRQKCKLPNPKDVLVKFCADCDAADNLVFTTEVVSYKKELKELKEQYELLNKTKDSITTQKERADVELSMDRLSQEVIKAQLKTDCYKTWHAIQTKRLAVSALQKCNDEAQFLIWNCILKVYFKMIKFLKPRVIENLLDVKTILDNLAPFTNEASKRMEKWYPPYMRDDMFEPASNQSAGPPLTVPMRTRDDLAAILKETPDVDAVFSRIVQSVRSSNMTEASTSSAPCLETPSDEFIDALINAVLPDLRKSNQ